MLFNSIQFVLFLVPALFFFHVSPRSWRPAIVSALSCAFYAFAGVAYFVLIVFIITLVYNAAIQIEQISVEGKKRKLLCIIVFLVGMLLFFKSLHLAWFSIPAPIFIKHSPQFLNLVIPLGISYCSFKMMSYLVDVYWEKIKAERNFFNLTSYLLFFPQILCGPIQRADSFLPQLENNKCVSRAMFVSGLRLMLFGFFKKLVIADSLGVLVDNVFDHPEVYSATALWVAFYCFALQLYADFSGLTDIAIGIGKLFGFNTPQNFDLPFFSQNIQDFWRRWHMTLTTWVADYVFMPLRMKFRYWGTLGLVICLNLNMLIIALWHNIAINFLFFGLIQGIYLSVSVLTLKTRDKYFSRHKSLLIVRRFFAPLITFHLVAFSFIFVRATSPSSAFNFITGLSKFDFKIKSLYLGVSRVELGIILFCVLLMEAVHIFYSKGWISKWLTDMSRPLRWGVYYLFVFLILSFAHFAPRQFIYFKF